MEKYGPWLLIGIGVIAVIWYIKSQQQPAQPVVQNSDFPPIYTTTLQPGPTDHSFDIARLQANLQTTGIAASIYNTLLQRDFAQQQLAASVAQANADRQSGLSALNLQLQAQNQNNYLNLLSSGMVR